MFWLRWQRRIHCESPWSPTCCSTALFSVFIQNTEAPGFPTRRVPPRASSLKLGHSSHPAGTRPHQEAQPKQPTVCILAGRQNSKDEEEGRRRWAPCAEMWNERVTIIAIGGMWKGPLKAMAKKPAHEDFLVVQWFKNCFAMQGMMQVDPTSGIKIPPLGEETLSLSVAATEAHAP